MEITETEIVRPVSGRFTVENETLRCTKLQISINDRNIRGQGVLYLLDTGTDVPDRIILENGRRG